MEVYKLSEKSPPKSKQTEIFRFLIRFTLVQKRFKNEVLRYYLKKSPLVRHGFLLPRQTLSQQQGGTPMVRHASLFSQLVAFFRRNEFHNLVFRHNAERYTKGFSSWDQFVAMLFCQFAQAKRLREICGGLPCCLGKLRDLKVKKAPNKSTLSYDNAHRPWWMFQDLS